MAQMAASTRKPGFRTLLRNRYFMRLWIAQLISQVIQNASYYGSIVLIAGTFSTTATGGIVIAFSLPAVLFGVPAGVMVDRLDKRSLLWMSNAGRAIATIAFVALIFGNTKNYIPVYILIFLTSLIGQFFAPAEGASIPLLVADDELVSALSLFNITFSLSQALGFVIVAPVILLFGPTLDFHLGTSTFTLTSTHELFIIIGLAYILCAVLTWSIPHKKLLSTTPKPTIIQAERHIGIVWRGIVEAGNFVWHDKRLLIAVLQLTLGGTIITIIGIISGNMAQVFLNREAKYAAIVFIPAGLGLVLGSALMPKIINRIGLSLASALGVVGISTCVVLLTFSRWLALRLDTHWYNDFPYLAIAVVMAFGIGMCLDLVTLPAQTAMQQRSPDWVKGRVLAFQTMLLNVATIPISLIVGVASDTLSLPVAMNLLALFIVILGLSSVYFTEKQRVPNGQPFFTSLVEHAARPKMLEDSPAFEGSQSNPLPTTIVHTYEPADGAAPTKPTHPTKNSGPLPTRLP